VVASSRQRLQHRHALVLGLPLWLDMDVDDGRTGTVSNGLFDAVADDMRVLDRHAPGHDQVELDEGHTAGGACSHIVRLNRTIRVLGDDPAQVSDRFGIGHLVHQSAHGLTQHAVAGPQDVERDQC